MKDTEPFNPMGNPGGNPGAPTGHPRAVSAKPAPTHHGHPPPPKRPPKKVSSTMPPIIRHAADRAPTPPRSSASSSTGSPADLGDIDRKSQERIRRGKIDVDAKIDLHGMRQSEAHQALIARISRARLDGKRVLLVVTGKGASKDGTPDGIDPFWARGGGVLKAQVPKWLREDPLRSMIFSVQQAHQRHGGAGALYVFLKRVR